MLDICLLGTGGMMPLPYRNLTSLMARLNGSSLLIDCGEATQLAIKNKGWGFKNIDTLCITHFHADHISGLPGLLLTMGNADRTEPLNIVGPKGLTKVVSSLRVIAPELPFETHCIEIEEDRQTFYFYDYKITAFRVNHNILCYGYSIELERPGKFNLEAAKKLDLPRNYWKTLQNGESVDYEGKLYTPDMVMGEKRQGLKVTYCTDTRPVDSIVENAKDSDIFICEGMYGDPEKAEKARQYKHMTMLEAASLAKKSNVKELWLTHFSPSMNKPFMYEDMVKAAFKNTVIGKDGLSKDLKFMED